MNLELNIISAKNIHYSIPLEDIVAILPDINGNAMLFVQEIGVINTRMRLSEILTHLY